MNRTFDLNIVYLRDITALFNAANKACHGCADTLKLEAWRDSHKLSAWENGCDPAEGDDPAFVWFIDGDGDLQGGAFMVDVPTMLGYVPMDNGTWYSLDEDIILDRKPFQGSSAEFNALMENQE
jgi:hypothetical protein